VKHRLDDPARSYRLCEKTRPFHDDYTLTRALASPGD